MSKDRVEEGGSGEEFSQTGTIGAWPDRHVASDWICVRAIFGGFGGSLNVCCVWVEGKL